MPETGDLLVALRDVGITPPCAGDAGDHRVRATLTREIAGGRRPRHLGVPRRPVVLCSAIGAAAAVAAGIVVATGHGGGSHGAAAQRPIGQAHDTAYIVRRVRARLAHLAVAGRGQVLQRTSTIGNGTAADPIVHNTDWAYIDPRSGIAYQRSVDRSATGATLAINELVTTPRGNVLHTRVTFVNPSTRSYFTYRNAPPGGSVSAAASSTELGIRSSARQIVRALGHGAVRQLGTATVDGQLTIELSVRPVHGLIEAGLPPRTTFTLYVDARTYRPVQEVEASPADARDRSAAATSTSRWLPTTPATVALARFRVPPGYRRSSGPLRDYWTSAKPLFFIGY